jgi:UDP-N-acetylglucosamine--N-acetylmuramyl-(pentapeptide) pyrophosphoryl-undecaprenol N-acetylglucosamine transferase
VTTSLRTILLVGGGTGGHIFPNLAVLERLHERHAPVYPHFVVSDRPLDAEIMSKAQYDYTALPAVGLAVSRPWTWLRFWKLHQASVERSLQLIDETQAAAMVATGGFVSAPAVEAARRRGVPVAVVNLDAVPGKANRMMVAKATEVFTCYPCAQLTTARRVGLPIRRASVADAGITPGEARRQLGLDPNRLTILVTAGSQGATTINQMMMDLVSRPRAKHSLMNWQVLHLSGAAERDAVAKAYQDAKVPARVEAFCNAMGLAWRAATIAVCRAGAGTVAEVWANATPALFFPYPFHRDQHQRLNAQPLVDHGGAIMLTDEIDPVNNVAQLMGPLLALMSNDAQRASMIEQLQHKAPEDGAAAIAHWVATAIGSAFGRGAV